MTEDQILGLTYGVMVLVLVGSALIVRRLPSGKALRMALAWVAIFIVAYGLARVFDIRLHG